MRALLAYLLLCGTALAAPPITGVDFAFNDPIFAANVLCDEAGQIREIASSPTPNQVFRKYLNTLNDKQEPVCVAAAFIAEVVSVESIGTMTYDSGDTFDAWIVGITNDGMTGFVLYLEPARHA